MNKQNFTLEEIERQIELSKKEDHSFFRLLLGFVKLVIQILTIPALVYLVFAFLLGIVHIEEASMLPNFAEGDYVVFNRLEEDYSFGDVIVIQDMERQSLSIQRIIGVPGDTVEITSNQKILINGKTVREDWQSIGVLSSDYSTLPFTLKEGEYFALADNRSEALRSGSSKIETIEEEYILGIVVYRFKMSK